MTSAGESFAGFFDPLGQDVLGMSSGPAIGKPPLGRCSKESIAAKKSDESRFRRICLRSFRTDCQNEPIVPFGRGKSSALASASRPVSPGP